VWEQQLEGYSVEIVLCDDGSTDVTHELALALQSSSQLPMQVLTHSKKENRGVSASRNMALRHARGAFIALLDADDVWLPSRLAVQLHFFERHPDTQCVCSLGYNRDLQGRLVRGWNGTHIAGDYTKVPPPDDFHAPYTFEEMIRGDPVVNSTLLIRRDAIAKAGGYPELMAHQGEDWLLLTKLSLQSPIVLLEEKLIDYTVHSDSYTNEYVQQGFAYGVQIEFLHHLVHWMIRHPAHRELGEKVFRHHYPRMIATRSSAYRLIEEYYLKYQEDTKGVADFEAHLASIYAELSRFRIRYGYLDRVLGPFWNTPVPDHLSYLLRGLKSALRNPH
ncbi:MAG: glycosyltransferase, partial [Desulfoferrobacter sp.]